MRKNMHACNIEDMPLTERIAISVLRQEGFKKIRWASFLNWYSRYDFIATKNGIEYLIEVKRLYDTLKKGKLRALKFINKPTLFLFIGREYYYLFNLEALEREFDDIDCTFTGRLPSDGRITIPYDVREWLNLKKHSLFEMELQGNKMLITFLKFK